MNLQSVRPAKLASWVSLCCAGSLVFLLCSTVQASDAYPKTSADSVKIVELFTSHGCSSCPPADRLLGKLLDEDEDLLALEFHVDYWNSLVHGSDGNFIDPFSKPEYSMRQREYSSAKLSGRPGVYTPQTVINGVKAAVGSNRKHIVKALNMTRAAAFQITLQLSESDENLVKVRVTGDQEELDKLGGTDITLYRYIDSAQTQITGGENSQLNLTNHHIVFAISRLGQINSTSDMSYNVVAPAQGEGCVVVVQEGALTPIYAAVECP